jgi:hypothetical protein
VFYTNAAHAQLVAKLKRLEAEQKLREEYLVKREQANCRLRTTNLKINNETLQKKLDLVTKAKADERQMLLKQIEASKKTSWWKTSTFGFVAGVVLSGALTALSIWGIGQIKK